VAADFSKIILIAPTNSIKKYVCVDIQRKAVKTVRFLPKWFKITLNQAFSIKVIKF
jgi:hypothetical protein